MKKKILIVCKDNLFLSKVGEGFLKKFGAHWKEIVSAGIKKTSQQLPDSTLKTLKELGLEGLVDVTTRSIESFSSDSVDYIVLLSDESSLLKVCQEKFPGKDIATFEMSTENNSQTISDLEKNCLRFIKSGPIKRWLNE